MSFASPPPLLLLLLSYEDALGGRQNRDVCAAGVELPLLGQGVT